MSIYFYTETAFHHEGDLNYMNKLIEFSKKTGSNGVKFQVLLDLNSLTTSTHKHYSDLEKLIFNLDEWRSIFDLTIKSGLDIIAMPLDNSVFKLILEYKDHIKYLELHSVSFNDKKLKKIIKDSKIPLILGTGGRTIEEIEDAVKYFGNQLVVLMHGFQSFPSKIENVRLDKIEYLRTMFPNLSVGYADHSSYGDTYSIYSNEYAYILGARFFEKHITLKEGEKRIDYESALGHEKLKMIIDRLIFLDSKIFSNKSTFSSLNDHENKYRLRQKVAVASKKIKKGDFFNNENVAFKMSDVHSELIDMSLLVNKKSKVDLDYDQVILNANIE